ncbi:MAG: beta-propeller fold lactonase family protein [Chloroflexi bacterium]|nr:beta-propeller fold lactonase family protein [Chloroflexota bacterium]
MPRAGVLIGLLVMLFGLMLAAIPAPTATQAQTAATPTPLPLYALPDSRINRVSGSSTIAMAGDGRTFVSANMINNSATIFIPAFDQVVAEIPVGRDPRGAAITPDNTRALITNRLDSSLSVIDINQHVVVVTIPLGGAWAYGVVAASNEIAYVSLMGSDQIAVVDLVAGAVRTLIDVPDAPAGLALWGDFLYVTHFWSGDVSLVYLPRARTFETVSTGAGTALFQSIEIDITRGIAYLPQTRLNDGNPSLTFDTTALPIVNVVTLSDLTLSRRSRIALDTADQPVNMPFATALDRFGRRLYVANAGSDSVTVIDLNTGQARAHVQVGANPRGLLLSRDNTLLYVHNALDGTVTTVDTRSFQPTQVLPIIDLQQSLEVLLGAQLFHSAGDPRLAADGWLSCATCHFDGMSDGNVWMGFPGGPRNTPLLYQLPETVPYTWTGSWDELADVEHKIRWLQAGAGLAETLALPELLGQPMAGQSPDLDLLTNYLRSLQPPSASPAAPQEAFARGREVFAELDCASCHVGPAGTDLQGHDVGTGALFDTPSLRWLWLSAPYYHDGSATTLRQVFELAGAHQLIYVLPPEDIDALVTYLLAFSIES